MIKLMPEQAQQPAPQPQVTTSQGTNWKKIGLTVLIIIVVTGLISVGYWFFVLNKSSDISDLTGPVPKPQITTSTPSATPSAKKDETADWEIYQNKDYGFEVKLPEGWVAGVNNKKAIILQKPYSGFHIEIFSGSGAEARDSNICSTHYPSGFPHWDYNQSIKRPLIVAVNRSLTKIVSPEGNRFYVCVGDPDVSMEAVSSGDISEDLFDQILSTFKFLD